MWRGEHHLSSINVKKTKTDAWRGKEKLVGTRQGWSTFSLGEGHAAHFLRTPRGQTAPLRTASREEVRGRRGPEGPEAGWERAPLPSQAPGDAGALSPL